MTAPGLWLHGSNPAPSDDQAQCAIVALNEAMSVEKQRGANSYAKQNPNRDKKLFSPNGFHQAPIAGVSHHPGPNCTLAQPL